MTDIRTVPMARRRCVSPDGRPGGWGSAIDAMVEAVRMKTGKSMDPMTEWNDVTKLWRGLRNDGWRIETERGVRG